MEEQINLRNVRLFGVGCPVTPFCLCRSLNLVVSKRAGEGVPHLAGGGQIALEGNSFVSPFIPPVFES